MATDAAETLGPTRGIAACGMVHNTAFCEKEYRGMLCPWDDKCPFKITRVNYVYDVPVGAVRGGHAHRLIHELCTCPVGSMSVTVEDATGSKTMTITSPTEGIHIAPGTWITLHDFVPGTVLVIMCSGLFDPKECIRTRVAFDEWASPTKPPDFIPVNTPALRGNEAKYLLDCAETGWISSEGAYVKRFESEMAAYCGRAHAVAVANGTAAIDIAVDALGIGPGDEVIMPTFTIMSCATQIARVGAVPVVVDSDASMNMDVAQIEAKITPRTKAILAVHIYHFAVDMTTVCAIAKRHSLYVIEDAAEMIGQTHRGRLCGSFGDVSTMSFYPNKHITTGEGGMVLTDDRTLFERIAARRNLCFGPPRRFVHSELGWNYRMTNMQAAVGCAQLETLPKHIVRKRQVGRLYGRLLQGIPGLELPPDTLDGEENMYWVYAIVVKPELGIDADVISKKLGDRKIGARTPGTRTPAPCCHCHATTPLTTPHSLRPVTRRAPRASLRRRHAAVFLGHARAAGAPQDGPPEGRALPRRRGAGAPWLLPAEWPCTHGCGGGARGQGAARRDGGARRVSEGRPRRAWTGRERR